jgi:type IV pilus assembly protein PilV
MQTRSPITVRHAPALRSQRGVSMVELLVSLLIFTFGMLGLAGLQTRTLTFNQSSLVRSQATALISDVLDRMRADRKNAEAGTWDTALTEKSTDVVTGGAFSKTDMKDWKGQVEALMPSASGKASIVTTLTGADTGNVTITIQWDDNAQTSQTLTTTSRL